MKKFYLLLSVVFLVFETNAQSSNDFSRHLVNFRIGYSIPVSNTQVGSPRLEVGKTYVDEIVNSNGGTVQYSEKNSFGSRGAGLNISLGYGYMITENFSFEIDFNYLQTFGFTDSYINRTDVSTNNVYSARQESKTSMFRVMPLMGVYANKSLLIRPYAKFGLIIPLAGGTAVNLSLKDATGVAFDDLMPVIDEKTYNDTKNLGASLGLTNLKVPTKTDINAVTSGSFSLGFLGRLGAEYNVKNVLNNKLTVFAEMEVQMLTVLASQTKIKTFTSTVDDETLKKIASDAGIKTVFTKDDLPEILLTTDYIKEVTHETNSSYDITSSTYNRDKAFEQLNFRDSYNAFAFMIGVKFGF